MVRPGVFVIAIACTGGCGRIDFGELAGFDAAMTGDRDNDGVPDAVDNCPDVANPVQDNEDGDAFGDACDPCPPVADTDPPRDSDGDGVSDQCDPHPTTPGDAILAFAGFAHAPTNLEIIGNWAFANGQAKVTGALNSVAVIDAQSIAPSETVSTHVTIDAMFGNAVARAIGVGQEISADTQDATVCVFGVNPGNNQVYAIADNRTTNAYALQNTTAVVGAQSAFASTRAGTGYSCAVTGLTSPLTGVAPLTTTPNRVGLFARSASASYDWLLIVTSP